MARRLLYPIAKNMRKSFKLGSGKRALAMLLLLVGAVSPVRLEAQDKRSTVATLRIQIMVMPTVVAMQQAGRPETQPSQTPISFNFSPANTQNGNYSTQQIAIPGQSGAAQTAVLKTLTVVPE